MIKSNTSTNHLSINQLYHYHPPPSPLLGSTLSESIDLSVDPCDDFFEFACGGWVAKHPIPEGADVTGTFFEADDLLNKRMGLILDTPAGA